MSQPAQSNKTLTQLLSEDPDFPAWIRRYTLTPPAWLTACHEGAHCIAALKLCDAAKVHAFIFDGREGITLVPKATGVKRLLTIAVGEVGARLARRYPPPAGEARYSECEAARKAAEAAPGDGQRLTDWRGTVGECVPSRKAIRNQAAIFVREHEQPILAVAVWLFLNGSGRFSFIRHSNTKEIPMMEAAGSGHAESQTTATPGAPFS